MKITEEMKKIIVREKIKSLSYQLNKIIDSEKFDYENFLTIDEENDTITFALHSEEEMCLHEFEQMMIDINMKNVKKNKQ